MDIKIKAGSTVLVSTGAVTMTGSITDRRWKLECMLQVLEAGSFGKVLCNGSVQMAQGSFGAPFEMGLINTSFQTLDTTVAQTLDITATWSAAASGNSIVCTHAIVEDAAQ